MFNETHLETKEISVFFEKFFVYHLEADMLIWKINLFYRETEYDLNAGFIAILINENAFQFSLMSYVGQSSEEIN